MFGIAALALLAAGCKHSSSKSSTTNLLTNGGFETDQKGWSGINGGVVARDATHVSAGSWAQKLTTPGSEPNEGNYSPPTPVASAASGQRWTAQIEIYSVAGGEKVALYIQELNAAENFLTTSGTTVNLVAGWQTIKYTRTLTNASTSRVSLAVRTFETAQAVAVWIDEAKLNQRP